MLSRLSVAVIAAAAAWPASAEPADELLEALGVPEVVEVMRSEGLDYGRELALDMLPGGTSPGWSATVSAIYDTDAMLETVRGRFTETIGDRDVGTLIAYFESDEGQRVVSLEIDARRAMTDKAVEEAARETFRGLDGTPDPRLETLEALVDANDLIEANVAGALNASYNFYAGLVEGGAIEMSQAEILSDVWAQEEETRQDTREWLYGFLLMAYEPLDDDALDAYVEISSSAAGQVMNQALFDGFNTMYDDLSRRLGQAAALRMQGQDL